MHIFSFHIYFLHYCRGNIKRWFLIAQNHCTKVNKKKLVVQENLGSFIFCFWYVDEQKWLRKWKKIFCVTFHKIAKWKKSVQKKMQEKSRRNQRINHKREAKEATMMNPPISFSGQMSYITRSFFFLRANIMMSDNVYFSSWIIIFA